MLYVLLSVHLGIADMVYVSCEAMTDGAAMVIECEALGTDLAP